MFLVVLKKYSLIAKSNLKHNFLIHLAIAILLLCITPVIFGTSNLDALASAVPLEMFVVLIGIILLTPVLIPEQQKDVRELIETKYTSQTGIYLIRIFTSVVAMFVLIFCFACLMGFNGSSFPIFKYVIGTFFGAFFLGSLGVLFYVISDHIAIAYMIPMVYYAFNMSTGSKYLGKLHLFSMSQGSFEEKYWLMFVGIILVFIALLIRTIMKKIR